MKDFLQGYNTIYAIAAIGCITILMKSIAAIIYYRLTVQSEQMSKAKNKYIKSVVERIKATYKLKREIHNADCIVDKSMLDMHVFGISVEGWKNFGAYGAGLIVFCTVVSVAGGVYYSMPDEWIMANIFVAGSVLALVVLSEIIFKNRRKYRLLKFEFADYINNILIPKFERESRYDEEYNAELKQESYSDEEEEQDEEDIMSEEERIKLFEEIMEEYL